MDVSRTLNKDEIENVLQQIVAAIRKTPTLPDKEPFVLEAAAVVAASADLSVGASCTPRGDAAAIRELNKLAEHLTAAIDRLHNLSEEAFQALHDEPDGPEATWTLATR